MKSFAGVLLNTLIAPCQLTLIDEPEAFLHPPQARLLGRMLAKASHRGQQVISTHSGDFLQGIIDQSPSNLTILRLTRKGQINPISQLSSDDLKKFWNDPLLRHSNVLDGLFHQKVVICESDSDCRFYSAMSHALSDTKGNVPSDTLFVHCGGKHRMPALVNSLKRLSVPITVVADFDVIRGDNPLKALWLGLGGDWDMLSADWKLLNDEITKAKPELEADAAKQKITAVLDQISSNKLSNSDKKQIEKILDQSSPWALAKKMGENFVPSGNATKACRNLLTVAEKLGLMIVPCGELESFVKLEGSHGPRWVNSVLESHDLKNDPYLETARRFVSKFA